MIFKLKILIKRIIGFIPNSIIMYFKSNKFKIHGKNNKFDCSGSLRNVTILIFGDDNKIEIECGVVLHNVLIRLHGNNNCIFIGLNVQMRGGELWIEDDFGVINIDSNTTIESAHLAVTESNSKIIIGKDCMLAKFIEFRTGDSHSIIEVASGLRVNYAANVILEDHVWIGAHAKILKGVKIGQNSVIGTAAVVTKSIPPNSIAVGIPAKVINKNITWKRERI